MLSPIEFVAVLVIGILVLLLAAAIHTLVNNHPEDRDQERVPERVPVHEAVGNAAETRSTALEVKLIDDPDAENQVYLERSKFPELKSKPKLAGVVPKALNQIHTLERAKALKPLVF
jgi:hypothetical protein